MRPINRGSIPLDENTQQKIYTKYQNARQDLIDRVGEYCSYCEMQLDASLAIEHVRPKQHNPAVALTWENFLFACTNCNSTKGSNNINLNEYYWPDKDNTFRALNYREGGIVEPNTQLTPEEQNIALHTLQLTGLDKIPNNDPSASDRRWNNRREAWDIAKDSLDDLMAADSTSMRRQILRTALAKGYWSIWMTVFNQDPDPVRRKDMLCRFIDNFRGTDHACFDQNILPVKRVNGAV